VAARGAAGQERGRVTRVATALAMAVLCAACAPLPPLPPLPEEEARPPEVVAPAPPDPRAEPEPAPVPPVVPPLPAPPDEAKQLAELVVAAQRFAALSLEEQKRDYNAASQLFARERTPAYRLRLALILATPGSAVQDDQRALALLEGLPAGSGALRQFGALLQAQVADRARAARRADQLKEQLDALRAVERSIIERREVPAPRKP
jgi:hypothetical protein